MRIDVAVQSDSRSIVVRLGFCTLVAGGAIDMEKDARPGECWLQYPEQYDTIWSFQLHAQMHCNPLTMKVGIKLSHKKSVSPKGRFKFGSTCPVPS